MSQPTWKNNQNQVNQQVLSLSLKLNLCRNNTLQMRGCRIRHQARKRNNQVSFLTLHQLILMLKVLVVVKSICSSMQNTQPTAIPNPNPQGTTKKDQTNEPAPSTVVQSFVAKLRHNQAKTEVHIDMVTPKVTTKQGLPAVIFDMDDFMVKLVVDCKYTLVGKFTNTMPKIELIRKSFIKQTQLTGGVDIAHYNTRHVYWKMN